MSIDGVSEMRRTSSFPKFLDFMLFSLNCFSSYFWCLNLRSYLEYNYWSVNSIYGVSEVIVTSSFPNFLDSSCWFSLNYFSSSLFCSNLISDLEYNTCIEVSRSEFNTNVEVSVGVVLDSVYMAMFSLNTDRLFS